MASAALSEMHSVSLPVTIDSSIDVDDGSVPLWIEITCVFCFTVGFMLWRFFMEDSQKQKKGVDSKSFKGLEAKFTAGDNKAGVKAWRAQQQKKQRPRQTC